MAYRVYNPCDGDSYIFTARAKAENYVRYLQYFTDNTVRLDVDYVPNQVDVVKDITKQRLRVSATEHYACNEKPRINDWFMGRINSTRDAVGSVTFHMGKSYAYGEGYIEYFLSKVYAVQVGESSKAFHKRVLKDMNEELARRVENEQVH